MRAIIYARVSTEEQKKKGYSIEAQLEACRNYAKAKGWEVVMEYEESKSGKDAKKRVKLQRALTLIEEGGADILLVWRLDRLTRSIIDFVNITNRIGRRIVSVMEGFDMNTPEGKMLAQILATFAEYERELISERTKEGLKQARAEGKKIGKPRKYSDDVVKKVRELYKRGFSQREISEKVGIPISGVISILYRRRS